MTVKDLLKYEIKIEEHYDYIYCRYDRYLFWFYQNKSQHFIRRDGKYNLAINKEDRLKGYSVNKIYKENLEDKL